MAITLDGIELPDLVFESEFSTGIQSVVETALDGTPNIWEQSVPGRSIDLIGGSDSAWMTREMLADLYSIASIPGAYYELLYEDVSYTVRFRNEEPPAIEAEPILSRPNPDEYDYYRNIRIKLMEI